jgi:hypothetical protein
MKKLDRKKKPIPATIDNTQTRSTLHAQIQFPQKHLHRAFY